jgi:Zn finger protein HypA/HybF involved in hydrogenase expression
LKDNFGLRDVLFNVYIDFHARIHKGFATIITEVFYSPMQKNLRLSVIIDHLLQQSRHIGSVQLAVGESIPFSDEQIHSQWSGSPLGQIALTIRRVPTEQQCMACFEKYRPANAEVSCPRCGSVGAKIITGEEFYLESIEE